ncbi:MAG TPA: cob(I)yrinic acid a,c-diamide adenosyltransferase [Myxococcota bacterium]|nr:cob(I)yrinic acid a,c-diamide adenosyltransferase [Myxococcota bacterium]
MRITKVYTRGGDKGLTSLVGGTRVPKNHPRLEAYGTIDELNTVVGLARTFNRGSEAPETRARLDAILRRVQNELFSLGSDLATPPEHRREGMIRVGDEEIDRLEREIDELNEELGPLTEFILPGGGPVGAFLHQARTVCRRAERQVLTLAESEGADLDAGSLRYVNRLSDHLFVLGRWAARSLGEEEHLWDRPGSRR